MRECPPPPPFLILLLIAIDGTNCLAGETGLDRQYATHHIDSAVEHKLGQIASTAICGNDITSSCLYVAGLAAVSAGMPPPVWAVRLPVTGVLSMCCHARLRRFSPPPPLFFSPFRRFLPSTRGPPGRYTPISLAIVAGMLYLFRSVYSEALSALPLNGGSYTVRSARPPRVCACVRCALSLARLSLPLWLDCTRVSVLPTQVLFPMIVWSAGASQHNVQVGGIAGSVPDDAVVRGDGGGLRRHRHGLLATALRRSAN